MAGAVAASAGFSALLWAWVYGATGGSLLMWLLGAHAALAAAIVWAARRGPLAGSGWGVLAAVAATFALAVGLPMLAELVVERLPAGGRAGRMAAAAVVLGGGALAVWVACRTRIGTAAVLVLVAGAGAMAAQPPRPASGPTLHPLEARDAVLSRVAVIGIDGGDWSVIDPLLADGELPHLAGLIERGAHGVLRSIDPMYSPVVWTSIFSGRTPEEHGIRGWSSALSTNRRVPLLWELVGGAGGSVRVANVPGTWPPTDVEGRFVSGFPMPQLIVAEGTTSQFLGRVVGPAERPGTVPTEPLASGVQRVPVGRRQLLPRGRARNTVVELAMRRRWLSGPRAEISLEVADGARADGRLELSLGGHDFALAEGEWSPWLDVEIARAPAILRARRLRGRALYLTPPFQSVRAPIHPITASTSTDDYAPDGRYVVEGAGWRVVADRDLRDAIFEHLTHVHELQSRAARLLARGDWSLFAFVYTLTDRVQHSFWRWHEPEPFGATDPAEIAESGERVREAYRIVDAELGRLLRELGDETTILVVSDHGAAPDVERGFGGHRDAGIIVAAGPGIRPSAERIEASVYDVTPTVLAGIGLPVADELSGKALVRLFEEPPPERRVDSFGVEALPEGSGRIDRSTEEQLRALGYVE